ncbi:MAG: hypothetical protein RSE41_00220 [Clostridia bacterium]
MKNAEILYKTLSDIYAFTPYDYELPINVRNDALSKKKRLGEGFYYMTLKDLNEDPAEYPSKVQKEFSDWGIIFKPDGSELTDIVCKPHNMCAFSSSCDYINVFNPDNKDCYVIDRYGTIVKTFGLCDYPYFYHSVISCNNKFYNYKGELICEGNIISRLNELLFIEMNKYPEHKVYVINATTCEIEKIYK